MIDFDSLSSITKDRLRRIYDEVKEKIFSDSACCNNWVRKQFFESIETGFPEFVENFAIALNDNEISWYEEDEDLIEYCVSSLRLADFLHKP